VLFISHLVDRSFLSRDEDFYFGKISSHLSEYGISAGFALNNHTGMSGSSLLQEFDTSEANKVIFGTSLSLQDELFLYRRAIGAYKEISKISNVGLNQYGSKILQYAKRSALSADTLSTLRLGLRISKLIKILRPKAIVVTYEGHAWERIVFASARKVNPTILCIGYMHSALFESQHSVRRLLSREFNPDLILTSGNIAKSELSKSKRLCGIQIAVLGSVRTMKTDCKAVAKTGDHRVCLVLPEGINSEVKLLFDFALGCARATPGMRYIFRLHPATQYDAFKSEYSSQRIPSNLSFSERSLSEDITQSSWVLYRGTTAVVEAILGGLTPVYLKLPNEISIDILHEISSYSNSVTSIQEFQNLLECGPIPDFKKIKITEYCKGIFTPFDGKILVNFLRRVL